MSSLCEHHRAHWHQPRRTADYTPRPHGTAHCSVGEEKNVWVPGWHIPVIKDRLTGEKQSFIIHIPPVYTGDTQENWVTRQNGWSQDTTLNIAPSSAKDKRLQEVTSKGAVDKGKAVRQISVLVFCNGKSFLPIRDDLSRR